MFHIRDSRNKVVKIGRGVWFRRGDMTNALLSNSIIGKEDGGYYWVDKEYYLCQYTDSGVVSIPLNTKTKKEPWKVPFNDDKMLRYGYGATKWVDQITWQDDLTVKVIKRKYVELVSNVTGIRYIMGYPDYLRASAKYMSKGVMSATFKFVKYGSAYGIKVKDLWYI